MANMSTVVADAAVAMATKAAATTEIAGAVRETAAADVINID